MTTTAPEKTISNPARKAMIDSQLRTSGVNTDFVLRRMGAVEREDFVPASARGTAYMDRAIKLANGGWLAAPLVQGRMLSEADPRGSENAIVVDGGSGYLAELLRPLVKELRLISTEEALKPSRSKDKADLLLIDGAVEQVPASLIKRMAENARVVTGVVSNGVTRIAVGRVIDGKLALIPVFDTGIPVLQEFTTPKGWSF